MAHKRGLNVKAIIALICLALIISGVLYLVLSKPRCTTQSCFLNSLWKCERVDFSNEQANSTWKYSIKGNFDSSCRVDVTAVSLNTDFDTANALVGKTMTCDIPNGLAGSFLPESKIEYCHGLLKESLQDLIIQKLHLFIVQNIGQINQTVSAI